MGGAESVNKHRAPPPPSGGGWGCENPDIGFSRRLALIPPRKGEGTDWATVDDTVSICQSLQSEVGWACPALAEFSRQAIEPHIALESGFSNSRSVAASRI